MMNKIVIIALFALITIVNCGVLPAAYISPFASTYNAHTINHAVAAPVVAAPAAKLLASPYALPYSLPYSSPYAYSPYAFPSNYYL
ncbi:CLUMA_CG009331, isoform A [Clunio marinus]|uniref:CLUMA_CG009331, isoform A n=1 Tax=Clunio marinus TaxID=568069 RepID=A0A1J1I6G4_9DIPT|nr:CLUMA_CG009331, isoform A [Clunio marinus]